MSQLVDDAAGAPTEPSALTLSLPEVALLAYLGGRLPLVLPSLPEQEDEAWPPIVEHLAGRELLSVDGNEVTLAESAEALLIPIVGADFAGEATIEGDSRTWLEAEEAVPEELVVEFSPSDEQTVAVNPIAYDDLEARVTGFLQLDGADRGTDGETIALPVDQLNAAVEQAAKGETVELPAAPEFGAALAGREPRSVELRWIDEEQVVGSSFIWIDADDAGLWVVRAEASEVVELQQRSIASFRKQIAGLLP
jgi:hypothetical protein